MALRQFLKDAPQGTAILLYHHSSTLYYDSIGSYVDSIRANYYPGWFGIPMTFADGVDSAHSTGTIRGDSLKFAGWFNARRAVQSPLTLTITGLYNRSTRQGRVKATITATAPIMATNLNIHYRLLETLPYRWQTMDTMDHAVRLNFPGISGVPLTIANGQTKADSQNFTMLPGWNINNVRIAVFVQSDQTREILQGGWAPLTSFSGVEVEGGQGVKGTRGQKMEVTPNPFKGKCSIRLAASGRGRTLLGIYNSRGGLVRRFDAVPQMPDGGSRTILWDGKDEAEMAVPGGVYFVRLVGGTESLTRRVVLLR